MPDNINVTPGTGATVATDDVSGAQYQRIKIDLGGDGVASPLLRGQVANAAAVPVTLSTEQQALLTAIEAKLSADPATQTTLAALLAKVIAAPATEASQTTIIGYVDGIEGSLVSILEKIIAAPATEAKQDTQITALQRFSQAVEYETVAASQTTQTLGATGAAGDYLAGVLIVPATTSAGQVQIKDGANAAITIFVGGASSVTSLVPFMVPLGLVSVAGAWQVTTGADVSAVGVGNFT